MAEIIIQYVLILLLVTGLGYLAYLLKDKVLDHSEDYFGLSYVILGDLTSDEATPQNAKKIIRIVSGAVQYVENNYINSENTLKEEEAIKVAVDAIRLLKFKSNIDNESLKYLIRLAAALLPPTNKVKELK